MTSHYVRVLGIESWKTYECLNSPSLDHLQGCLIAVELLVATQEWNQARNILQDGLKILPFLIAHLNLKLDQERCRREFLDWSRLVAQVHHNNDDGYNAISIDSR